MIRRFTIGRDRTTDVPVADDSVSRFHAEIWLAANGTLVLADRGSSNGTEVIRNGQASPLSEGEVFATDQVRFGAANFTVKDLIEAIELKNPGALTPDPAPEKSAPPPLPSVPPPPRVPTGAPANSPSSPWGSTGDRPAAPPPPLPPPRLPVSPPPPPLAMGPAPLPPPLPGGAQSPPRAAAGPLVRCECGAIKTLGQTCPGCHR